MSEDMSEDRQAQDSSATEALPEESATALAEDPTVAFEFSPEREERYREIVRRYPTRLSAIMPTLWLCQDEWGWLRPGVPEWVAARLEVPLSRVYEIISFYTMYYTEDPGTHNLQVCRNISCHMAGSRGISEHLCKKLGVGLNETDSEGRFRVEEVECLGACGMGPMMQVGKDYYEHLTPEKVDALVEQWRRDG